LRRGENWSTGEKHLGAEKGTNNKLNPHMTPAGTAPRYIDRVSIMCQPMCQSSIDQGYCLSQGIDRQLTVQAFSTYDLQKTDLRSTHPLRTPRTKLSIKNDPITTRE